VSSSIVGDINVFCMNHFFILFNLIGWLSQNTDLRVRSILEAHGSLWHLRFFLSAVSQTKQKRRRAVLMRERHSVVSENAFDRCASGFDDHCDPTSYQNAERRCLLRWKRVLLQCNYNTLTLLTYWRSDFILDVTTISVRTVNT